LNKLSDIRKPTDFGRGKFDAECLLHREYETNMVQAVPTIDVLRRKWGSILARGRQKDHEISVSALHKFRAIAYLSSSHIMLRRVGNSSLWSQLPEAAQCVGLRTGVLALGGARIGRHANVASPARGNHRAPEDMPRRLMRRRRSSTPICLGTVILARSPSPALSSTKSGQKSNALDENCLSAIGK
jgi:hypothetical protein